MKVFRSPFLNDATRRAVLRRVEDRILQEAGNRFERLVLLDRFAGDVDYFEVEEATGRR